MSAVHPTDHLSHPSVLRVRQALVERGHADLVRALADSARTAREAAAGLGVDVGQIASSIVFSRAERNRSLPVLVVTSGRHRVQTTLVCAALGLPELGRVDADFVREWSGFAIGGVSPVGWQSAHDLCDLVVVVDAALADYETCWAAAGHPHTVFPTSHDELVRITGGVSVVVGE